jgi:hypothetical protein
VPKQGADPKPALVDQGFLVCFAVQRPQGKVAVGNLVAMLDIGEDL